MLHLTHTMICLFRSDMSIKKLNNWTWILQVKEHSKWHPMPLFMLTFTLTDISHTSYNLSKTWMWRYCCLSICLITCWKHQSTKTTNVMVELIDAPDEQTQQTHKTTKKRISSDIFVKWVEYQSGRKQNNPDLGSIHCFFIESAECSIQCGM